MSLPPSLSSSRTPDTQPAAADLSRSAREGQVAAEACVQSVTSERSRAGW